MCYLVLLMQFQDTNDVGFENLQSASGVQAFESFSNGRLAYVSVNTATGSPLEASCEPTAVLKSEPAPSTRLPALYRRIPLHQCPPTKQRKSGTQQNPGAARGVTVQPAPEPVAAPKLAKIGRVAMVDVEHLRAPSSTIRLGSVTMHWPMAVVNSEKRSLRRPAVSLPDRHTILC